MVSGTCQPCRLETLSLHLWNQRLGFGGLFKKLYFGLVWNKALEIATPGYNGYNTQLLVRL